MSVAALGQKDVIWFCVDFIPDLKKIGLPQSQYEGRLGGKGMLGGDSIICRDGHSWAQAHYTVLQNSTLVAPYISEHKNIVRSQHPGQSDDWITRAHMSTFGGWLQTHLMSNTTVGDELYLLAKTPSSTILTYEGSEINGNTFYTIAQDQRAPTKTVVSSLMQQPRRERKHIMVTVMPG